MKLPLLHIRLHNPWRELTGFERGLWITSVAAVTVSFLLSPAMNVLTLIASLIGVTALIFVAKGYVLGQVLTVVFAVFYGIISFFFRYYGEMITYLGMTAPIAVFSVISWIRHPYRDTKEVAVSRITLRKAAVMFLLSAAVTAVFYFILRALGNANLLLSTLSVTTSFLASWLTFLRSPWYGAAYACNDLILIGLWILATLEESAYLPMVVCFCMFLCSDSYGFYHWQRMRRRQAG